MGSGSSISKQKQETMETPSHSYQNRSHKKGTLVDAIHGEKESKEKMDNELSNPKIISHPGGAVKKTDKSTDTPGGYKTTINISPAKPVTSTDQPKKDLNHNAKVDKKIQESPTGRPRTEQKIISKINTTLKKTLDDGNLHEKLRLMEWLESKIKDLNTISHNDDKAVVATNNDVGEEGIQNTDGDWSKIKQEIRDYKSTKQELLNVVSEIAGARLKNNNPAIADLSDTNRASKLAERFSELYDNEWTDVVEVLRSSVSGKKMTAVYEEEFEEKCIYFMVDLVKVTFENCKKKAKKDLDELIDIVVKTTPSASVDVSKRCKDFMKLQMSSGEKSLKRVIELVGGKVDESAELKNNYSDFYKALGKTEHYHRYRKSCVELCWYMCLQDPPVAMVASITPKTTKDHFRAYTRSGKNLGFVVWPALFLHEDGPLLYKGVAQYTDKVVEPKQPTPGDTSEFW